MTSKIGRLIPLLISGALLISSILTIKKTAPYFELYYDYGAGNLFDSYGYHYPASSLAKIYLHISLLLLFAGGIFLFAIHKRLSKQAYLAGSIAMLGIFLLRPVISLITFDYESAFPGGSVVASTLKGYLLGIASNERPWGESRVQRYLTGIVLLLLLVVNLILAFRHKQDPVYAQRKQQQRDFLNQQAQARQSAWSAQQQMQAQALRQMPMPAQQQGAPSSLTQELERLQQMYQSGVLTEAEFIAAKQRIIGG
jgi:hypothetical protein